MAGEKILSIAFDQSLMQTREGLLKRYGYIVTSVQGSAIGKTAAAASSFDLFLVGHAAPLSERVALIRWLKENFPAVPVIALRHTAFEGDVPGADCTSNVIDPTEWLQAVANCIAKQ